MMSIRSWLRGVALLTLAAAMTGCEGAGYVASAFSDGKPDVEVDAEYRGLENQRVAVLVDADLATLNRYPLAQLEVCKAISEKLAKNVPGITVVEAKQVVDFQHRNIYWNHTPYADLAKRLNVNRIVTVDLAEYRMHEPGNQYILRGTIAARVGVAETDSERPNDLVYNTPVNVIYPSASSIGAVNQNEKTIRLATLDLFSTGAAGKFYDYKTERTP